MLSRTTAGAAGPSPVDSKRLT